MLEIESVVARAFAEYKTILVKKDWQEFWSSVEAALALASTAIKVVVEDYTSGDFVGAVLLFLKGIGSDPTVPAGAPAGSATIRLLAVLPAYRRKGAATQLLSMALSEARICGQKSVITYISDDMPASRRIFVARGFTYKPELDFEPTPNVWVRGYMLQLND